MKYLFAICMVAAASTSLAWEGTHPGLPPSSASTETTTGTTDGSILSDVNARTTSINTKYGTSMTADEIKAADQNRRAQRDSNYDSAPAEAAPTTDTY